MSDKHPSKGKRNIDQFMSQMDDVFQNLEDEKNPVSTGKRIKLDEADWKPAGKEKVNRQSWKKSKSKVVD